MVYDGVDLHRKRSHGKQHRRTTQTWMDHLVRSPGAALNRNGLPRTERRFPQKYGALHPGKGMLRLAQLPIMQVTINRC